MKKFQVTVKTVHHETYIIEAENLEEAKDRVREGDYDEMIADEYSHQLTGNDEAAEDVDEADD